jgi:hypothetical protein
VIPGIIVRCNRRLIVQYKDQYLCNTEKKRQNILQS